MDSPQCHCMVNTVYVYSHQLQGSTVNYLCIVYMYTVSIICSLHSGYMYIQQILFFPRTISDRYTEPWSASCHMPTWRWLCFHCPFWPVSPFMSSLGRRWVTVIIKILLGKSVNFGFKLACIFGIDFTQVHVCMIIKFNPVYILIKMW